MLAGIIGGWEIVLIFAMILILFGAKRGPDIIRGFRKGWDEFCTEFRNLRPIDREAHDAGRSIGGIYGKRAAEALTPGNELAELYNPAAFDEKGPPRPPGRLARFTKWLLKVAARMLRLLHSRSEH